MFLELQVVIENALKVFLNWNVWRILDFGLNYYSAKENVVNGTSNKESLRMSVLVMWELDLLV